jgi:hypothetical protein
MVDEEAWKQLNAFVAGVFSVCLILLLKTIWQALQLVPDSLHNNVVGKTGDNYDNDDDESWVDPWNAPIHATNRFMKRLSMPELPSPFKRRQHWPWETIRQRFVAPPIDSDSHESDGSVRRDSSRHSLHETSSLEKEEIEKDSLADLIGHHCEISIESAVENTKKDSETDAESSNAADVSSKQHKALCIGSIFGMDVGGTLAKLVYFEQKPPDSDPLWTSLRARHYARAASAQAVVMARIEKLPKFGPSANCSTTICRNSESSGESFDSNISSTKHEQYMMRRRSFSIALTGRAKKIQEEEKLLEQEGRIDSTDHQSEQDLERLYTMRQDSLPDDIRQFRRSVDFHSLEENTYKKILDAIGAANVDNVVTTDFAEETQSPSSSMCRSKSMFDMSSLIRQKAEALDRFYNFARRLGDQEDAIRDYKLSFYCRELGGEFHFMRFETRRMKNAMDLIRYNNLHLNIQEMG